MFAADGFSVLTGTDADLFPKPGAKVVGSGKAAAFGDLTDGQIFGDQKDGCRLDPVGQKLLCGRLAEGFGEQLVKIGGVQTAVMSQLGGSIFSCRCSLR